MTALAEAVALTNVWHSAILTAYELGNTPTQDALATAALTALGISPTAAALSATQLADTRLALDVEMWRFVESQAALLYDFSADGGSYQRSQLAANASKMRRAAEDRAAGAELTGYSGPAIEITRLHDDPCGYPDEVIDACL